MSSTSILTGLLGGNAAKDTGTTASTVQEIKKSSEKEILAELRLDEIAVLAQVRTNLNEDNITNLMESIKVKGLLQKCELRHFFNDAEKEEVRKKFPKAKYVLVLGEHRFESLSRLNKLKETFIVAPKSRYKNMIDVISAQLGENMERAEMTVYDIANGVGRAAEETPEASYKDLGISLGLQKGGVSKYMAIYKHIDAEKRQLLDSWGVKGLNSLHNISTLIANEEIDWLEVLKEYAGNEEGEVQGNLITESLLSRIKADLKAKKEGVKEVEETNTVVVSAAAKAAADAAMDAATVMADAAMDAAIIADNTNVAADIADDIDAMAAMAAMAANADAKGAADANANADADAAKEKKHKPTQSGRVFTEEQIEELKQSVKKTREDRLSVDDKLEQFSDTEISFLRGVAFVLSKDPDCDTKAIAEMIQSRGFFLDVTAEDILKSIVDLL